MADIKLVYIHKKVSNKDIKVQIKSSYVELMSPILLAKLGVLRG